MSLGSAAVWSFNSLQTGKWIQRKITHKGKVTIRNVFQFPSNGKVDSENSLTTGNNSPIISFNSLQTGKWIQRGMQIDKIVENIFLFQFPSNGKVDSESQLLLFFGVVIKECFNSLQTGKWIQRFLLTLGPCSLTVSIPFKRESGFRVNPTLKMTAMDVAQVSIPFKRESVFRAYGRKSMHMKKVFEFQFPSNGKVYSE